MFSIAALNESDSVGQCELLAPTKEAQEFHLCQSYHEGLLKLQDKDYARARELFEAVLNDPLISSSEIGKSAGDSHLLHLRFLSLKNLALVFLQQGYDHYNSALRCYLQAVEIDSKDSVVWNKLGTLACSMGLLSTSRWAFEQGLFCSPNNWNCMEKLLEILIAIGDEVSTLSVAELILRHWPSHSRALHVKKIIEDAEPLPFAPRGIDKLEPKHIRLNFSEKRKISDDRIVEDIPYKKLKETVELQLSGATWEIMADALLVLLLPTASRLSGQETLGQEASLDGKFDCMPKGIANIDDLNFHLFTKSRIKIHLSSSSSNTVDLVGQEICPFGENMPGSTSGFDETKMMKDKEEHHQERRSMRLERLRSRKSGKDELEFTGGKDPSKLVLQTLEPFILKKSGISNTCYSGKSNGPSVFITYSSCQEYNDVIRFISKASKNCGPYHIGHMLLEEFSKGNFPIHGYFTQILEIEKLTRHWGQDRTPLCSLFLAELCFDQGSMSTNESKQVDFFHEASYHLCKVIELVALDSSNTLAGVDSYICCQESSFYSNDNIDLTSSLACISECCNFYSSAVEVDVCQQSTENSSTLTNGTKFWIRFFWLSGGLSLLHVSKEKALKEFIICLSILKKNGETSVPVLLSHCRVKSITIDKVLNEINLLILDAVLQKVNGEFMEKGLFAKCIDMLSPLLLSTKDVYLDMASASSKESEDIISLELRAIDVLILACQKTQLTSNELFLKCHRRKMQLVIVAAGMSGFRTLQNDEGSFHKGSSAFHLGDLEYVDKRWLDMVAEEIQDVSQIASKMRIIIDQNDDPACIDSMEVVIGDIQSLLLTVISSSLGKILSHRFSVPGSSSPIDQSECCLLVDAAIGFCKLQHLHPSVSFKAQVDLIVVVHDFLAEYGLCCAGRDFNGKEGAFLKFAIKHLLALDMKLRSLNGSNGKDEMIQRDGQEDTDCSLPNEHVAKDGVENGKILIDLNSDSTGENNGPVVITEITNQMIGAETEKLELGIESALDQSFFCLYGLNINPDSSNEDELAMHKNTSRGDYQTKEQCADVFQYVLPYAKAFSRNGLVKLRRVFRSIRKHFPQPPDELLLENAINNFLDSPELFEDKLYDISEIDGNQEAALNLLNINGRGSESFQTSAAIGSETYLEVYENLYYLIGQAEDTSATDKYPGFVLKKEGEDFVEQNAKLYKYDLLYNTLRFESWHKLANIYDEEVDLLLNDGSKHINILDWRKNGNLTQRVEIGRRRSRRCLLMSLSLAKSLDQQSQIHELLALVYYDNIQNVVPFYDQRIHVPKRDATWKSFCQNSMKHFEKAFALKPEWLHAFYLGKLCEKLGYSHHHAFSYYSKAASLNPSAVDPVYRLHASRLKLLYTHGKKNLNVLQVVAAHSFNHVSREKILNMFNWTSEDLMNFQDMKEAASENSKEKLFSGNLMDEAWDVLYDDCLCALEICVEGDLKHFHKARHILAQGYYRRGEPGDLERAKDQISFCFKSSRSAFTINMWEIDGATKKGRRKIPVHGGNKRILEVSLSESSRKFITCIRKYILFYLDLLSMTRDLLTLERAYVCLRTDKKFYLCLCDLVPIAIGKYVQILSSSIRNAGAAGSSDNTSLEQYLDRMFNLFIDHASILSDLISLPEFSTPEISESNLCCYIHQYIDLLESGIRLDVLEGINEKIRKRFKNPKLSSVNFAKIYRHACLAWCRALVMKLASLTPVSDACFVIDSPRPAGALENDLLLYVDLQPDEFFSTSSLEGFTHSKGFDLNWYQTLSKIKDVCIKQASEENLEALAALMRYSYNFFRESSSAALPSGINLYTVSSSQAAVDGILWQGKGRIEFLDLSIPRKLLLWAYTLFHGRYANISSVLKFCEDNAKSRMRRGGAAAPTIFPGNIAVSATHTVEMEDNSCTSVSTAPAPHQEDVARISNTSMAANEVPKPSAQAAADVQTVPSVVALPVPQLGRCSATKGAEIVQESINQQK